MKAFIRKGWFCFDAQHKTLASSDRDAQSSRGISSSIIKDTFEYGEIDRDLNIQPLTEAQMVQQSKLALKEYHRQGSGVGHDIVRKWADSLGTNEEG